MPRSPRAGLTWPVRFIHTMRGNGLCRILAYQNRTALLADDSYPAKTMREGGVCP